MAQHGTRGRSCVTNVKSKAETGGESMLRYGVVAQSLHIRLNVVAEIDLGGCWQCREVSHHGSGCPKEAPPGLIQRSSTSPHQTSLRTIDVSLPAISPVMLIEGDGFGGTVRLRPRAAFSL